MVVNDGTQFYDVDQTRLSESSTRVLVRQYKAELSIFFMNVRFKPDTIFC